MKTKETYVLRTLRPFLLVLKLVGLFGCTINGKNVDRSGKLANFVPVIWIAITYYFIPVHFTDFIATDRLMQAARSTAFFLTIASDMCNSIFQQRRVVEVFDKIYKYDRRVANLGFTRKDKTIIYWIMLSVPGMAIIAHRVLPIFFPKMPTRPFVGFLRYWYYPTMSYFVVMKFCMIVHMIYQRFAYLNDSISKHIDDANIMYNRRSVTIYELRYLHSKLCEAVEILMEIYSPFMLLWCAVMMHRISVSMENFFHNRPVAPSSALVVIWIVSLCAICSIASDEANKIGEKLIGNRSLSGNAADTMDRIEMVLYLCNHELRFTAMRMYTVNKSFLLAIMNMLVTYMTFKVSNQ